ncbi:hypothetical protein AKO1_000898 [Acrasis kona]|uniref:Uncharacterized protein n=1 Tax=Acrasis kona TaxID=1008807 RepID=A0AAW2ZPW0_9EUKA
MKAWMLGYTDGPTVMSNQTFALVNLSVNAYLSPAISQNKENDVTALSFSSVCAWVAEPPERNKTIIIGSSDTYIRHLETGKYLSYDTNIYSKVDNPVAFLSEEPILWKLNFDTWTGHAEKVAICTIKSRGYILSADPTRNGQDDEIILVPDTTVKNQKWRRPSDVNQLWGFASCTKEGNLLHSTLDESSYCSIQ